MKNPIIVALDVDDPRKAQDLFRKLQPFVGGFKIGPRLTFKLDRSFLKDLSESGICFFDHKFFDIPTTTVSSVEAAVDMGAHWITVHALNGPTTLKDLSLLQAKISKSRSEFRILVVTVLTSFTRDTLPPIWISEPIQQSVEKLALSAHSQGLRSFVCSPEEVRLLKDRFSDSFLVIPGIRPEGSLKDDQSRTATPLMALQAGASALVIGRPIIENADPISAARSILESLN